jgi:SAM-dependent methyltransferase
MNAIVLTAAAAILLFSFVILFGAPYLPTLKREQTAALDLLDLKPGQTLLELGCGDGRMLRAAAQRGIRSVGYELNPLLYIYAKLRALPHRGLVSVRLANYWRVTLPPADGVYVFLLERFMPALDAKIAGEIVRPVRVVSYAFEIPRKKPVKSSGGMFLYAYSPRRGESLR